MQKITPFLWFNDNAAEAVNFYTSIFSNSGTGDVANFNDVPSGPKENVMVIPFTIMGQEFIALNGGPMFKFNEAISFVISCETQEEVDYYWNELTEGGAESMCGWLKDKFGVSWQVVPTMLSKVMAGPDASGSKRAMGAMMKMRKLDIATLQNAYDGK